MSNIIVIDEQALIEIIQSNVFQSTQFTPGEELARAISGDYSVRTLTKRIVPFWDKKTLFLLQSRVVSSYLVVDSIIFPNQESSNIGEESAGDLALPYLQENLHIFQRVCRFALKYWKRLKFSKSEIWSQKTECGVVFPYPFSSRSEFRISLCRGLHDRRIITRHGEQQLFAFASGVIEAKTPTSDQEREYKRVFEQLSKVRASVEPKLIHAESIPADTGYHPLILTDTNLNKIRYQSFSNWLPRLTKSQEAFVTSTSKLPQRVEGPAGTGKTLCLILRAYWLCKMAMSEDREFRVLFVTHSEQVRASIEIVFSSLSEPIFHKQLRDHSAQSIELMTLQSWCANFLGDREITSSQFLDQDALQSKEMRLMLIEELIGEKREYEADSFQYLSSECRTFFVEENISFIAEMMQHEIGVMIKGRAAEDPNCYIKLPFLSYGIPVKEKEDRQFIYSIYLEYQKKLNLSGVFDTDDIVLSALGRINTPIWRRRRGYEGYDAILIDEAHLFNLNELSVFHHLLKSITIPMISFSIDRAQAAGERGITTRMVKEILTSDPLINEVEVKTLVVFRCAPKIVRLAEAITSAGATLFTTFENPLHNVDSVITADDEDLSSDPIIWRCTNDNRMIERIGISIKKIKNDLKCPSNEIAVIAMTDELLPSVIAGLNEKFISNMVLVQRADIEVVKKAGKDNAVIVSHPDYVGGLEFKAVIIVGVDSGRFPPINGSVLDDSRHFLEFKSCNRLYVAISRARIAVEMAYSLERGRSHLLDHAVELGALIERNYPERI